MTHPVRLRLDDDLRRSRLTVFFRALLALPHVIWLLLWSIVVIPVALINWIVTLVRAQPPRRLHAFLAAYVRYLVHVHAFILLAANPFPGFTGRLGSYPVDVELPPPARQNRWKVAFRIILALPPLLVSSTLLGPGGAAPFARASGFVFTFAFGGGGVAASVAFLAWFACLARGRITLGFRNLVAYALRYGAQLDAYLFLVTDRYPDANPAVERVEQDHPVRLVMHDDLKRSRLTVFFRLLLAIPHLLWVAIWSVGTYFVAIPAWLVVLIDATPPRWFADFLGGFVRYQAHVTSYLFLVANPFPGFLGRPGTYPVEVTIDSARRQNRWTVGFRAFLLPPAFLVSGALVNLLFATAILSWFVALAVGRAPLGLRNAGAFVVRYQAQLYAYMLLVTGRYPNSLPESDLSPIAVPVAETA